MNIFVTGGSGFLGQRLIARLTQEGHTITALSRSEASDRLLQQLGAQPIRGSLDNLESWSAALAGQEVVVHAASPVAVWGAWEWFYQGITQPTLALYQACDRYQVRRFVYISSESVLQGNGPLLDIDERLLYPQEPNSYYGKAKKLAEQALLESAGSTERLILRPTYIWGRGTQALEDIIQKIKAGQFIWVDQGRHPMEMVHVENVVEAIRLALVKGGDKTIYFVTDDHPLPAREFLTLLLKTRNTTLPTMSLPSLLVRPLAALVEATWRRLGLQSVPPLSDFQVDFVALPRRYKIDKIKRELGYQPVYSLERGLQEMAETTPPE